MTYHRHRQIHLHIMGHHYSCITALLVKCIISSLVKIPKPCNVANYSLKALRVVTRIKDMIAQGEFNTDTLTTFPHLFHVGIV